MFTNFFGFVKEILELKNYVKKVWQLNISRISEIVAIVPINPAFEECWSRCLDKA